MVSSRNNTVEKAKTGDLLMRGDSHLDAHHVGRCVVPILVNRVSHLLPLSSLNCYICLELLNVVDHEGDQLETI